MSMNQAPIAVTEYIITNELYSFQSLSEETQDKLIGAYGPNFGQQVNINLGF